MKNFGTLYRYEFKKIIRRRMVWIDAVIMLIFIAIVVSAPMLGNYYVDGEVAESNYEGLLKDLGYEMRLTGRLLDGELIAEMQEAYAMLPEDEARYSITEEYETYARPYSAVFHLIRRNTGMKQERMMDWVRSGEKMDADMLRERRLAYLEAVWEADRLTEAEKNFWREQEKALEWPLRFSCVYGWDELLRAVYTVNLLTLFLVVVCLVNVFTEEHGRRTDQLILCSRLGRRPVYLAKISAGVSFAVLAALALSAFAILLAAALFGAAGFSTAVQVMYPEFSGVMTAGGAILLAFGCIPVTAVFIAVFVMLLAELLHNNTATLAIMVGILFVPMFVSLPAEDRVAAQILQYMPGEFVSRWGLFGDWMVPVFGRCFYSWQAVPAVYLLLSALCALLGQRLYCRYQVKGR